MYRGRGERRGEWGGERGEGGGERGGEWGGERGEGGEGWGEGGGEEVSHIDCTHYTIYSALYIHMCRILLNKLILNVCDGLRGLAC